MLVQVSLVQDHITTEVDTELGMVVDILIIADTFIRINMEAWITAIQINTRMVQDMKDMNIRILFMLLFLRILILILILVIVITVVGGTRVMSGI